MLMDLDRWVASVLEEVSDREELARWELGDDDGWRWDVRLEGDEDGE